MTYVCSFFIILNVLLCNLFIYLFIFCQELKDRVLFDLTVSKTAAAPVRVTDIRRKGNVQEESRSMGVICIRDVFSVADDEKDQPVSMVSFSNLFGQCYSLVLLSCGSEEQ